MRVTVLAGGVGGAKLAHGMALAAAAATVDLTIVVNTADDLELHGLAISPDLDTVMYTLAGLANSETGWGLADETWSNADMLARYGAPTWFRLGDRDLATHLVRTERLRRGERLSDVTAGLARALGVAAQLLPMCDAPVRTKVRTADGWLDFQDYFIRHQQDEVTELRFDGIEAAKATAEVLAAIAGADLIAIAPSNPFLSIDPILAVPGILDALLEAHAVTIGVSPIVAGAALKGPADRMLVSLGEEASAVGVARHYVERYPGLLDAFVVDELDAGSGASIERLEVTAFVAQTVMRTDEDRQRLATEIIESAKRPAADRPRQA